MNVTRGQARDAFESWARDFQEHPEQYGPDVKLVEPKSYGESCADHFFNLITKAKGAQ